MRSEVSSTCPKEQEELAGCRASGALLKAASHRAALLVDGSGSLDPEGNHGVNAGGALSGQGCSEECSKSEDAGGCHEDGGMPWIPYCRLAKKCPARMVARACYL